MRRKGCAIGTNDLQPDKLQPKLYRVYVIPNDPNGLATLFAMRRAQHEGLVCRVRACIHDLRHGVHMFEVPMCVYVLCGTWSVGR